MRQRIFGTECEYAPVYHRPPHCLQEQPCREDLLEHLKTTAARMMNAAKMLQLPMAGITLLILVMLTPLFHGIGPHHFSRRYLWPYNGMIVSTDPVAADTTGARIIQAIRNQFFGKDKPISPPPHHIAAADRRFHLGNSSPERIELIRLGWEKGMLI